MSLKSYKGVEIELSFVFSEDNVVDDFFVEIIILCNL